MYKLQCGYCKEQFTGQSQFRHEVAKVESGFVSVRIDYDLTCFSCGKSTTVRVSIVSPLQIGDARFINM